jgi:CBS-domain-containing membrane protein
MEESTMRLRELMSTQVVTIAPGADLVEASRLMRKHHVGFLVVIKPSSRGGGVLAGVLTDRDIVIQTLARDVDPHAVTVADIMTAEVMTGRDEEGIATLLTRMRKAGIHRVPIVNGAGMVMGIVSVDDIIRCIAGLTGQLADTVKLSRRFEKRKRN